MVASPRSSSSRGGRPFEVTAKSYVLAGGGLENARLLLLAQRHWPQKFGGQNGPLGRFYCGHLSGYLAAIHFNQQSFAKNLWYQNRSDGSQLRHRLALSPDAQRKHALLNTVFWLDSFSVADPAHGSGALSMLYVGLALLGLYPRLSDGLAPSPTETRSRGLRRHLSNVRRDPKLLSSTLVRHLADLETGGSGKGRLPSSIQATVTCCVITPNRCPVPKAGFSLPMNRIVEQLPNLRIDFRFQQQDVESVVRSHEILDDWLQRENIGRLDYLTDAEQTRRGRPETGARRLSPDRPDPDGGRSEDWRGGSAIAGFMTWRTSLSPAARCFPPSGQANPTLPAVALALRLGDHLRRTVASSLDV